MRGKKHDARDRARAVGIAVASGNTSEAARQMGLNESTVRQWLASPEYAELRERNKAEVDAEWWAGVQAYQRSIMADLESASLRDKVGAFMVMFDKLALLRGEATIRTETRELTEAFDDHELAALRDAIHRHTASTPAEVAVASHPGTNGTTPA